jgi:hypothetical protein
MKIHVQRSGGFAGITTTFSLNDKSLTSSEIQQLEDLINKAEFFNLLAKSPLPKEGADYYTYNITIEMKGKRHNIKTTDFSMFSKFKIFNEFYNEDPKMTLT